MNDRRRQRQKPSPSLDWRALTDAARPQQQLPLTAPATRSAPSEVVVTPLVIRQQKDAHGRNVALVTGVGVDAVAHARDLRQWADQLIAAAECIEGLNR